MEILNREKLKEVLERWKEHPSVTGLMEKFSQLQSYTNKNYKSIEAYTKQKIKESRYSLVELPYIDVTEDPVRPELDLTFRQTYDKNQARCQWSSPKVLEFHWYFDVCLILKA